MPAAPYRGDACDRRSRASDYLVDHMLLFGFIAARLGDRSSILSTGRCFRPHSYSIHVCHLTIGRRSYEEQDYSRRIARYHCINGGL
jgi:hypothetical protein